MVDEEFRGCLSVVRDPYPEEIPPDLSQIASVLEFYRPDSPTMCIYFLIQRPVWLGQRHYQAKVVYIGETITLVHRISEHIKTGKSFDYALFIRLPPSLVKCLHQLEGALIKLLKPRLNLNGTKAQSMHPHEKKILEKFFDYVAEQGQSIQKSPTLRFCTRRNSCQPRIDSEDPVVAIQNHCLECRRYRPAAVSGCPKSNCWLFPFRVGAGTPGQSNVEEAKAS